MNLTQHIKSLRQEKNISQVVMAEKIGTSKSDYFYLERHPEKLTLRQLQNIALALSVPPAELITGEADGKRSPGNRFLHLVDYSGTHWAIGSGHIDRVQFSPTGIIITHANGYFTYLDNAYSDRLKRFLDNEEINYSAGNESVNPPLHFRRKNRYRNDVWLLPLFFFCGLSALWDLAKGIFSIVKSLIQFRKSYRNYKK